jgi:hypothetical protein
MTQSITISLDNQFGASLRMLENAITFCPEELWNTESAFWYRVFHCLFWTDYFLTENPAEFEPPSPFTRSEFNTDLKPDIIYSKQELLTYLEYCKRKANKLIQGFTIETLQNRWINDYKNYSMLEVLLYNLRHIQHHTAQLNMILRNATNHSPEWVSQSGLG